MQVDQKLHVRVAAAHAELEGVVKCTALRVGRLVPLADFEIAFFSSGIIDRYKLVWRGRSLAKPFLGLFASHRPLLASTMYFLWK